MTSHEVHVRWGLCEPEPGKRDWSMYDRFVDLYKRQGIRWVPFLVCGPAYTLLDWYYAKHGSQGYVGLEHNKESGIQFGLGKRSERWKATNLPMPSCSENP